MIHRNDVLYVCVYNNTICVCINGLRPIRMTFKGFDNESRYVVAALEKPLNIYSVYTFFMILHSYFLLLRTCFYVF